MVDYIDRTGRLYDNISLLDCFDEIRGWIYGLDVNFGHSSSSGIW
jgi:hypothetical protein